MEAISSSETSVYTRCTEPHIPEEAILKSYSFKNQIDADDVSVGTSGIPRQALVLEVLLTNYIT
jgi:hypothetical protein